VDLGLQQSSLLRIHRSSTETDFHPIPFVCYSMATATSTANTEQTAQRDGKAGTAYGNGINGNVMLETGLSKICRDAGTAVQHLRHAPWTSSVIERAPAG